MRDLDVTDLSSRGENRAGRKISVSMEQHIRNVEEEIEMQLEVISNIHCQISFLSRQLDSFNYLLGNRVEIRGEGLLHGIVRSRAQFKHILFKPDVH